MSKVIVDGNAGFNIGEKVVVLCGEFAGHGGPIMKFLDMQEFPREHFPDYIVVRTAVHGHIEVGPSNLAPFPSPPRRLSDTQVAVDKDTVRELRTFINKTANKLVVADERGPGDKFERLLAKLPEVDGE